MNRSSFLIALLSLSLALTALAYWPMRRADAVAEAGRPPIAAGTPVKIYLRTDAAGNVAQSYVGGVSNNVSLTGTLGSVDEHWATLNVNGKTQAVSASSILMIETVKP